ncbi:MAG TPA: hypothetical protein VM553_03755, partial [Dongiaceae bacterium]|nr:hypothetical protein [Dongiaceae bacterium]
KLSLCNYLPKSVFLNHRQRQRFSITRDFQSNFLEIALNERNRTIRVAVCMECSIFYAPEMLWKS